MGSPSADRPVPLSWTASFTASSPSSRTPVTPGRPRTGWPTPTWPVGSWLWPTPSCCSGTTAGSHVPLLPQPRGGLCSGWTLGNRLCSSGLAQARAEPRPGVGAAVLGLGLGGAGGVVNRVSGPEPGGTEAAVPLPRLRGISGAEVWLSGWRGWHRGPPSALAPQAPAHGRRPPPRPHAPQLPGVPAAEPPDLLPARAGRPGAAAAAGVPERAPGGAVGLPALLHPPAPGGSRPPSAPGLPALVLPPRPSHWLPPLRNGSRFSSAPSAPAAPAGPLSTQDGLPTCRPPEAAEGGPTGLPGAPGTLQESGASGRIKGRVRFRAGRGRLCPLGTLTCCPAEGGVSPVSGVCREAPGEATRAGQGQRGSVSGTRDAERSPCAASPCRTTGSPRATWRPSSASSCTSPTSTSPATRRRPSPSCRSTRTCSSEWARLAPAVSSEGPTSEGLWEGPRGCERRAGCCPRHGGRWQ